MSLTAAIANCTRLILQGEWRYVVYHARNRLRGLDLRFATPGELGLSEHDCHWYADSGGPKLARLMESIPVSSADRIVDIGCGKGGAMITLARRPFAAVDGVEISETLAGIARENLRKAGVRNARVFTCDACQFRNLDHYTFLYISNPFSREVMECVLRNLAASLERVERRMTLIYYNPVDRDLFEALGFVEKGVFPQDENPTVVFVREASPNLDVERFRDQDAQRQIGRDQVMSDGS